MARRPGSKKRKSGTKGRKRRSTAKPQRKWLRRLLLSALLFGLVLAGYLVYLDHVVQREFAGRRWAVPARIYGRPLELYPGALLTPEKLVAELSRLGYSRVSHPKRVGSWSRNRNRFLIRTRPFLFWDGEEPARFLDLRFEGGRLAVLKTIAGEDLALARLEALAVGSLYPAHHEDRVLVRRQDLPEKLVQALVAVEDRSFYEHHGIDFKAILRALWANLRAGKVVQGGSTLTQQLVKNFFLTPERSLWRKSNEILMALLLERRYSKDEILEAYANEIYLGQDGERAIHGVGLASRYYFNRPLNELNLAQQTLLVALVRGPSYYDPHRHPEHAKSRHRLVLEVMEEQGVLSAAQAQKAGNMAWGITGMKGSASGRYPAFVDLVRRQLRRDYREEDLTSEGLRIFTTLDPWVQHRAEETLGHQLKALEAERKFPAGTLEGAVVVASPEGGEILAVAGGRRAGFAGFNRALDAVRPIGSLVKPAVYLAALMRPERYSLVTPLDDAPLTVKGADGSLWSPKNYDKASHGAVPLHSALAHSYNLATVRLGMELGLDEVAETLQRLGMNRPVNPYPSLLLGAASLSPMEVTQIYQTLAAGGFHSPLRAIREVLRSDGQPLQRYPLTVRRAVPAGPVYLVNHVLQETVREGTGRGLARYLSPGLNLAGKTGTTDDLRDSWFAGFSGDKVAVVWVGRDDNEPAGLTGSRGALRVWGELMAGLRPAPLELIMPESVESVWIEPESGLRGGQACPGSERTPFITGLAPEENAPCADDKGFNWFPF